MRQQFQDEGDQYIQVKAIDRSGNYYPIWYRQIACLKMEKKKRGKDMSRFSSEQFEDAEKKLQAKNMRLYTENLQ